MLVYDRERFSVAIDWNNAMLKNFIFQEIGYRAALTDLGYLDSITSAKLYAWFQTMYKHQIEACHLSAKLQLDAEFGKYYDTQRQSLQGQVNDFWDENTIEDVHAQQCLQDFIEDLESKLMDLDNLKNKRK